MANIKLDKTHKNLIASAIDLGDWFLSLSTLSNADREAIVAVQNCLKKLPKVNDGTLAMYGFSVERGDETSGLIQGWDISIEYMAEDSEQQGGLEIFSSFLPIPESSDQSVLAEKKSREVYFHWPIGDVCNLLDKHNADKWMKEVSDPYMFFEKGDQIRIEVVFGTHYAEIIIPA
ncbi:MAG TPA: hypothetical protein ENI26_07715 [Methylophaga aminisulfidivorans]|uniref:Uncharacterized protein n=2 Tax=root TaxID=1 RepID=A0A7C1W029_9GAMM|nr:hypothetical protein [Methylophaga sp.]HEC74244.1 hypothetical protein [Methylophaga aminisulfidivorans]